MCDYPCWPRQRRSPVHIYVYIHHRGVNRRALTRRKGQKKAPKRLKGLNRCQSHNRRTFSYGASAVWHRNGSATSRTALAAVKRFCLKTLEVASAQAEIASNLRIGTPERLAIRSNRLGL
jgi:hypothetical protein